MVSCVDGRELFRVYPDFTQLPKLVARWRAARRFLRGTSVFSIRWAASMPRGTGGALGRCSPEWTPRKVGVWWPQRSVHAQGVVIKVIGIASAVSVSPKCPAVSQRVALNSAVAYKRSVAIGRFETMTYMRDSDWASMDHSLVLRTPLMGTEVLYELAPLLASIGRFANKSLFAKAPSEPVARVIIRRETAKLEIPINRWPKQEAVDTAADCEGCAADVNGAEA